MVNIINNQGAQSSLQGTAKRDLFKISGTEFGALEITDYANAERIELSDVARSKITVSYVESAESGKLDAIISVKGKSAEEASIRVVGIEADTFLRVLGSNGKVKDFRFADISTGDDGHNDLTGDDAKDALLGGDGADHLIGGAGRDSLSGGAGNDILSGGAAADSFVFSSSDFGNDIITDYQAADRIILSDVDAADISIAYVASAGGGVSDALISIAGSSASIRVVGMGPDDTLNIVGANNQAVSAAQFAQPTVGDADDNTFADTAGDDVYIGGAGNDVYLISANRQGDDVIVDYSKGDVLKFDGTFTDFRGAIIAGKLEATGTGTHDWVWSLGEGSIRISNVDEDTVYTLEFTDRPISGPIRSLSLTPEIEGTDGNDRLFDISGKSRLFEGTDGNDILTGNGGDDTFKYGTRDQGTINPYLDGSDRITDYESGDILDFWGADFSTVRDIHNRPHSEDGVEQDSIVGLNMAIDYVSNPGQVDVVFEYFTKTIRLEDVSSDTILTLNEHGADLNWVQSFSIYTPSHVGRFVDLREFSIKDVQKGSDGNDTLTAADGQGDVLVGGAGDDNLHGGSGSDVFIGGAGADRFHLDFDVSNDDIPVIVGAGNVQAVIADFVSGEDKLVIDIDDSLLVGLYDHNTGSLLPKIDWFDSAGNAASLDETGQAHGFILQTNFNDGLQVTYSLGHELGAGQDELFTVFLEGQTELLDINDLEIV